ncbi:TPA: ShlB/FhaC/HecB family hemolysin secretion/activation protein, partial [Escherichia coli]|nr:ShlB/FhaC/HecB family hemolysin secretion/activation protein [Escherichia coli]
MLSREIQIPELSSPDLSFPVADYPATRDNNPVSLVTLKHIRLTGAPEFPSVPVDAVLQKYTGRPLSFSDLRTMTASLTRLYRDAGLMVARVIIPPQVIRNGELSLTVLPGRADRTSLSNTSPLRNGMLTRLSETTLPEGSMIMRDRVERLAL